MLEFDKLSNDFFSARNADFKTLKGREFVRELVLFAIAGDYPGFQLGSVITINELIKVLKGNHLLDRKIINRTHVAPAFEEFALEGVFYRRNEKRGYTVVSNTPLVGKSDLLVEEPPGHQDLRFLAERHNCELLSCFPTQSPLEGRFLEIALNYLGSLEVVAPIIVQSFEDRFRSEVPWKHSRLLCKESKFAALEHTWFVDADTHTTLQLRDHPKYDAFYLLESHLRPSIKIGAKIEIIENEVILGAWSGEALDPQGIDSNGVGMTFVTAQVAPRFGLLGVRFTTYQNLVSVHLKDLNVSLRNQGAAA